MHPLVNVDFSFNIARWKSSEEIIQTYKDYDERVKKHMGDYFYQKWDVWIISKWEVYIIFMCSVETNF